MTVALKHFGNSTDFGGMSDDVIVTDWPETSEIVQYGAGRCYCVAGRHREFIEERIKTIHHELRAHKREMELLMREENILERARAKRYKVDTAATKCIPVVPDRGTWLVLDLEEAEIVCTPEGSPPQTPPGSPPGDHENDSFKA